MDPYDEYMQSYQPNGFQKAGAGMQAGGAATAALPWVSAGLSAAGILSSLYGNYKADKVAKNNFDAQRQEFEYQRTLEKERRQREAEQQALMNMYSAANRGDQSQDRLLNRYKDYSRQIGE